jgi:YVTN family beta-propeller protein
MRNAALALALLLTTTAYADTLLLLNNSDSTLSFVDPTTLKVMASIPTGDTPHEVEVSKDGRIAVVANYGTGPSPGSTLSIVDVKARKELKRLQLPLLRPHGLFAIGNHIYVTTEGSRTVARYDVAKGEIDWIAGTGAEVSHMVVVAAGETKIYTANIGSDNISVLDLADAPRKIGLKQIAVGKGPEGIDFSPDGKQIWTAHRADPNLSVIDTATDKVVKVVPTGTKLANRLKFTPDGKRVLISDTGSNELVVLDAASGEVVKRISTLAQPAGILIDPGGKRAFVACLGAKTVQVVDLATLEVVDSIPAGNAPDGMAWVP